MQLRENSSKSAEKKFDFIVLGAGIIGTTIATEIKERFRNSSVLLLERETTFGLHASGRNSGVLHAGFYYSPDSLKAKFCREGNSALKRIIKDDDIPVLEVGKVVVASREEDVETIIELANRAGKNDVPVEVIDSKHLPKFEPLAKSRKIFLWSPNSAVSDPRRILQSLMRNALEVGVTVQFGEVISLEPNKVLAGGQAFRCDHLINAAGTNALEIARMYGFGHRYAQVPFMGLYFGTSHESVPVSKLIYPAPHPVNPFLGVHVTRTVHGQVKIGPTAIPILSKDSYKFLSSPRGVEILESLRGLTALVRGKENNVFEILKNELPNLRRRTIIQKASVLVPHIASVRVWKKLPPGIRAQLVDLQRLELVQDFIVEGNSQSTHILNLVSPGWTSAIPFSKFIVEEILHRSRS